MSRTLSAAEAKAHLAQALRDVESGETVTITRYGRPVAILVPSQWADQLERLRAAGAESGLGGLIGRYSDGDELADALEQVVATRTPGRDLPGLE